MASEAFLASKWRLSFECEKNVCIYIGDRGRDMKIVIAGLLIHWGCRIVCFPRYITQIHKCVMRLNVPSVCASVCYCVCVFVYELNMIGIAGRDGDSFPAVM